MHGGKNGVVLLMAGVLSGCAAFAPVDVPMNPAEVNPWRNVEYGSLSGDAFLRQRGGGVVTCAGAEVVLVPDIAYWRTRFDLVRSGRGVTPVPSAITDVKVNGKCNAKGEFRFDKVPAGNWLVATDVRWQAGNVSQGGIVVGPVAVRAGEEATVSINQ